MTLKEIESNEESNYGSQASTCTLAMNTCQMDTSNGHLSSAKYRDG